MEELLHKTHCVKMPPYDTCLWAKAKRPLLPKATFQRSTVKFQRLHTNSDMSGYLPVGMIRVETLFILNTGDGPDLGMINCAHYFLIFIDCFTNYKFVYLLNKKMGTWWLLTTSSPLPVW